MTALSVVLLSVALVSVAIAGGWAWNTAQRLHRLHIRLDRSRDALQAALDRRCAVIAALYPDVVAQARSTETIRLRSSDLHTRLDAEEELAKAVRGSSQSDSSVPAELQDATTRVELALRFYNDAVTDTLALQSRPAVRALRLGGTAAVPRYADDHR